MMNTLFEDDMILASAFCVDPEAEDIVKSATRNAALKSEEIISDAHSRAQEIIERADKQIEAERRNAENELKNEVSDIALTIASKVIESELSPFEKQVLDLYMTKMPTAQIAKVLGREEKSTDNALQRLKAKIRKLL